MMVAAGFVVLAGLLLAPPRVRLNESILGLRPLLGVSQVALAVVSACFLAVSGVSPVLIALAVGTEVAVARVIRQRRRRAVADRRREHVLIACEGLAADLVAGLPPVQALRTMSEEWPEVTPVADAAAVGADVPSAFRAVSELPGAGMLRVTAAAWSVAHRSGAGLAESVGFAAETVRAEMATARVVATELAAALATARLLAVLPLGILVLGRGVGGDPLGFLLRTVSGQVCLSAGLALGWIGSVWLERIADQVEKA
jgi:tight adherence protein B